MAGSGQRRRQPLPANWDGKAGLRAQCLNRDGFACRWRVRPGVLCGAPASHADHIDPDGPQDDLDNLQALCPPHHNHKTSSEAGSTWAGIRRAMIAKRTRPSERHPGLVD
jgi:5-methylcytosine-specific restriction endonuclease McrA